MLSSDELTLSVMNDSPAHQSFVSGVGILRAVVARAATKVARQEGCRAKECIPQHVRDEAIVDLVRYFLGYISEEESYEEGRKADEAERSCGAKHGVARTTP